MDNSSLKNKAVGGVVWTSIQKFISVFVGFISSIILARLLSPEDYGCIGLLSIFIIISSAFIEGGFNSALVQKKSPSHDDYTVVFYWNITISTFCYAILFFAAPLIAKYYHVPLLCSVLRVQGLVLIINSLQTVHISQMYKQFRFKKNAIIYIITSAITLPVTIWMAYKGFGVWSLVAQSLLYAIIPTTIYWLTDHWLPLLSFSVKSFKELFSFGSYILLSSLITQFIDNIQGLLIGRLYNPARMGFYSKADSTQKLASQTINGIVSQVTFPLFSEIQDNKQSVIDVIKKINGALSFIIIPLLSILILLAKPIFLVLYSEKWLDSVPYFQILCLSGLTICLRSTLGQAVKSLGHSKVLFKWGIFNNAVGIFLIVGGLVSFGIFGMLIGMVLSSWSVFIVSSYQVSRYIGYSLKKQLLDLFPIFLISFISIAIAYFGGGILDTNIYIEAIIKFILFVIVYFAGTYFFKIEAKDTVISLVNPFIKKLLRK